MDLLSRLPKVKTDSKQATHWPSMTPTLQALLISIQAQQQSKPILVVTPDISSAYHLEDEMGFFAPNCKVRVFPDWETLPYDNFSPHQDIISDRLSILYSLDSWDSGVIIIAISTLMHQLVPKQFLHQHSLLLNKDDRLDVESFRERLQQAGYHCVSQVMEHGEFAVRGSLVDIFPMGSKQPFRIDLFDDEIDRILTFDVNTQRTLEQIDSIKVLPAHEFSLDEAGITRFRQNWRGRFDANIAKDSIYTQVSDGIAVPGLEYYLPLFFDELATFFDYLPENAQLVLIDGINQASERFAEEIHQRFNARNIDTRRPLLPPETLFIQPNQIFSDLKNYARVEFKAEQSSIADGIADIAVEQDKDRPLQKIARFIQQYADHKILIAAESAGRREAIKELFSRHQQKLSSLDDWFAFEQSKQGLYLTQGLLRKGFILRDEKVVLIAESELFGARVNQVRRRSKPKNYDPDSLIRSLAELNEGDPVVHIEHGIGRFIGLQTITAGAYTQEYLTIQYSGDDKLYVPVDNLHLVSRYAGTDKEHAPLHKLGTESWSKAKKKAAEKIRDVAAELLAIYAQREARQGKSIAAEEAEYLQFCSSFPFEETPDQLSAIEAVKDDLAAHRPMDRLVCGDVGFGKTEVAMRAAFIAVQSGQQVVVLVPTTLLAQQHYENFMDRFANWPVKVELMSRFRSQKQQNQIAAQLESGQVDIVVGTHKLLNAGIKYKDLGLVIIDEEHRFGVGQKEKLKKLRAEVDILTLTATPIPRTLNMSMSGMRDLSIIATPPEKRLAVKTFVRENDKGLIREAVMREIMRGGQVFFLHNSVDTIEKRLNELKQIVPEATIEIGHGQMREKELERVMQDFYHQRFNVLLCTTIIETGIDIPTANTIIIDRADKFGLAQLHQLRGRVGRSHHQAFAYLLIPSRKTITKDADRRLDAIEALEDLGSGFMLATHDLEIRGAGEILGEDQSGQMQTIGFTLFQDMLERAVEAMRDGKEFTLEAMDYTGVEMDLQIPALIPDDYLPDVNERLNLYKRIASCKSDEELDELKVEMIDRFGLLPDQCKNLFTVAELKQQANKLGISKLDLGDRAGKIEFVDQPNIEPIKVIQLIQSAPHIYKMVGSSVIKIDKPFTSPDKKINFVKELIKKLS